MAPLPATATPATTPKPKAFIAVMGQTGTGKSSFINLVTQVNKLAVGHSLKSCTSSVDVADPFEFEDQEVILLDTPGFNDTNLKERDILKIIAAELERQYESGIKLHGVIYLYSITEKRVGGIDKANFHIFRKICGDTNLKNVVIMTNMWSEVSEETGRKRVRELETMDDFFKPALENGAQMVHNKDNNLGFARKVISLILRNHPVPLVIQQEMVDEKKDITQTSAAIEVDKKIAAVVKKYEQQLKEQIAEAMEAARRRDEETRAELMAEANKAKAAIAKLEAERANQAAEYQRFRQQLDNMEEQRKREAEANKERLISRSVVSGYTHYITSDWDYPYLYMEPTSDLLHVSNFKTIAQFKWIFTRYGKNWRVQSAYNRKYLFFNPQDKGFLYLTIEPHDFSLDPLDGYNQFLITALDGVVRYTRNIGIERRD